VSKSKNWVLSDLSKDDVLELTIGDTTYKLSSYASAFALNEIPRAEAALAIGRDARNVNTRAKIHETAPNLNTMLEATVRFKPSGEFDSNGKMWPGDGGVIFEGYFMGFAHEKVMGKVRVVAHLIHWLVDLGFSSTMNSLLHPSSPASLLSPAVTTQAAGSGGLPISVSDHISHDIVRGKVNRDLWGGVKEFLCHLSTWRGMRLQVSTAGFGDSTFFNNERAQKALARIEGPAGNCSTGGVENIGYDKSVALPLKTTSDLIKTAVLSAISGQMIGSFLQQTFWDVLVGPYASMFGWALVPMVDRALIIADTPGWQGEGSGSDRYWRTIGPDEYAATKQKAMVAKPLKGVGIYSSVGSDTGAVAEKGKFDAANAASGLSGGFTSKAEADNDGAVLFIAPPPWLSGVPSEGQYAGAITGNKKGKPAHDAMSPEEGEEAEDDSPSQSIKPVAEMLNDFARLVFINNTLRGRRATITGKLRLDIAPGSHVEVKGSPESFLQGVDDLATDLFASVTRTTIMISAEQRQAVTSFELSNIRNEKENSEPRTSIDKHPFFGDAIIKGAPLAEEFEIK
jgi:hypothetical protein